MELNLAVLKLYQFNPAARNNDVVTTILLKSLMAMPSPDLQLALCLIGASSRTEDHDAVVELANLLETTKFVAFWDALGSSSVAGPISQIAGFADAIRLFAKGVIEATFQTISLPELAQLLGLDAGEAEARANDYGWDVDAGLVSIPHNEFNQAKAKEIKENLSFSKVHKVF